MRNLPEGAEAAAEALEIVKALPQSPDESPAGAQAQIELTLHLLISLIEWIEQGSHPDDAPIRPWHPGPLLEAGGDLDSAEAAYVRGTARGSQEAAVRLDQLREKRDLSRQSE